MWPSNCTLGTSFFPQGKKACSHKNLYTYFYSSFVCESSKHETTQKSFDRWMIKQTEVHPYHEAIKQTVALQNSLGDSPESYALRKKPVSNSCILHDSILIMFLKQQHYRNGEQICGSQGLKEGWGQVRSGCGYQGWQERSLRWWACPYLTVSLSTPWLWYCTLVLQDVTPGRNREMGTWIFRYYFSQLHVNLKFSQNKKLH